jgi:hypothetical protein
MSDIGLNLDGVIAFIVAMILAGLLAFSMTVVSLITVISARRHHQAISDHGLFPQIVGMSASLVVCLLIVIALLLTDRQLPPRSINVWFDHWLWAWAIAVLGLWPAAAYLCKRFRH